MIVHLKLCHVETDRNFIFCVHGPEDNARDKISLVFTDNKDSEGNDLKIDVEYCPFCGYSKHD